MATIKSEYYRFNGFTWDLHYFKTSMDMVDGLNTALSGKAPTVHYHDDRYYNKYSIENSAILMREARINPNGEPSTNLGTPSIAEMGLFQEQFNNKTEFHDINNIVFEEYNGTTWTNVTSTISIEHRKAFVGGDIKALVNIPSGAVKYRITLRATSYVYLNALYMYYSTQGNNTKVHIWKKHDSGNWEQHTNSDKTVSSWPGHLFLPFNTIAWHNNATLGAHHHEVRIEFIPTWSNANPIILQKLQIWGGYPAHKRTIYSVNGDKQVMFPSDVAVGNNWNNKVYHPGNKPAWADIASKPSWIGASKPTYTAADISDDDRQQYLDQTLADLEMYKLPTSDIIRSKNNLTTTSTGTGYTNTGLSVVLAANSTYKISMTGHWERQLPGTTAWAYRQSIISSAVGVYMRGMWTWYQTDAYSAASTTIAYSDDMSATSGTTGQTVTTPSATTAVSRAPMCFEGYIVTGSSSTTITFTHGTSVAVYPPTASAFRGVLTATKM